jgi:feruloyl esterase
MTQRTLSLAIGVAFAGSIALAPTLAQAQPTCAQLLTTAPIAGNPAVYVSASPATPTAVLSTRPSGRMYCQINVTWRDPAEQGTAAGYADTGYPTVDAFQTIRLAVVLPANSADAPTALPANQWGGRLVMTAGGGAQGSVPGLTGMIDLNPPAMGGGSDSGHGDANSGSGDSWGVIQGVSLNYGKIDDWAGGRSNGITVQLAKQLAQVYYGTGPARTYWNGCSGGGHMGWAQLMRYPEEYDGALIGAPAYNWQEFRLGDSWDALARKKAAEQTTAITQAQMDAANTAAKAACGDVSVNGVPIMSDPRACKWSATNNVCGKPGAPAAGSCLLNEIQAAAIDQGWDGPRNSYGRRIWGPYHRGIAHGSGTATAGSTAQVMRYNHFDNNFASSNLYLDTESINLAASQGVDVSNATTYENEALLGSLRTADYIDDNFPELLDMSHARGTKIIVYHGLQDPAIQFWNDIDFYIRTAAHFGHGSPDFGALASWYRLFLVPNAPHCPQVPAAFQALVDWVETGTAPDSLVEGTPLPAGGGPGGGGTPTQTIPLLCPFPQKAIYMGGSTASAASYTCGGNLQTNAIICDNLRTPYKQETSDDLQAYGQYNPSTCVDNSHGGNGKGH